MKPTPLIDTFTTHLSRKFVEAEAARFSVFQRKPRKIDYGGPQKLDRSQRWAGGYDRWS